MLQGEELQFEIKKMQKAIADTGNREEFVKFNRMLEELKELARLEEIGNKGPTKEGIQQAIDAWEDKYND